MHKSEESLRGERPHFKELIPRLHFEVWKDRPNSRLTDRDYTEKELSPDIEYNKRRSAWFGAVSGTIELMRYAMEDDGASETDLQIVAEADEAMKMITTEALEVLHQGSPEGSDKKLEDLISRGEEILEKVYDLTEKYDL